MNNSSARPQPKAVRPLDLSKYNLIIAIISMALAAFFIFQLFDPRLSFATDDSTYIKNALELRDKGQFPTFQGPLYPMLLLVWMGIFGLNLTALKVLSAIFIIAHIWVLYRALNRHVPPELQALAVLMAGVNAYILCYGSFTFSEPLFMLLQAGMLWSVLRVIDKEKHGQAKPVDFIIAAAMIFLMSLTRNVAFFAVLAPVVYFLIKKNFRATLWIAISVAVLRLVWELSVRAIFGDVSTGQAKVLLQRDYYDASKGYVDAADLIDRFQVNYGNYISVHLYKMFGLRKGGEPLVFTFDKVEEAQRLPEPNVFLSLIFLGLGIFGIVRSLKHHESLLYLWLYLGTMLGVTFVALQTMWNQDRLIVVYLPIILVAMTYTLAIISRKPGQDRLGRFLGVGFGCIVLAASIFVSFEAMNHQSKMKRMVKRGGEMNAYPEGIANYLRAAQWAGQNLQDTSVVACGKPEEAYVYGYPVRFTRVGVLTNQADTVLADLNRRGINFLLADQFGLPKAGPAAGIISQQRPQALQPLHQTPGSLPAYVFRLNFIK